MSNLRPYSQALDAWVASNAQDQSWLLRGQALQDVLVWSQGKRLSESDRQSLKVSQDLDRQEARQTAAAERARESEADLRQQMKRVIKELTQVKTQRLLWCLISLVLGLVILWEQVQRYLVTD